MWPITGSWWPLTTCAARWGAHPGRGGGTRGLGHIIMKMNSLVGTDMIDQLYAASATRRADTADRARHLPSSCGVPELSENIEVRSVVGRYLEHSRVYHFANGDGHGKPATYFGSADLMTRNLDHRVEAIHPVLDPDLLERLATILAVALADDTLAWTLEDRTWQRINPLGAGPGTVDSHVVLEEGGHPAGRPQRDVGEPARGT